MVTDPELIRCFNRFRDRHHCSVVDVLVDPEFRGPFMGWARLAVGPITERDVLRRLLELASVGLICTTK